jgi:hypothetical protein
MNKEKLLDIIKNPNDKLIAVDLDWTLCEWEFWWDEDCIPNIQRITYINWLYKKWAHIIIYTARDPYYFELTQNWLVKNGVMHHGLAMMRKIGADLYIDDKCLHISDVFDDSLPR